MAAAAAAKRARARALLLLLPLLVLPRGVALLRCRALPFVEGAEVEQQGQLERDRRAEEEAVEGEGRGRGRRGERKAAAPLAMTMMAEFKEGLRPLHHSATSELDCGVCLFSPWEEAEPRPAE